MNTKKFFQMIALIAFNTIFVFPAISAAMLPLYVRNILHFGPESLGWLMAGILAGYYLRQRLQDHCRRHAADIVFEGRLLPQFPGGGPHSQQCRGRANHGMKTPAMGILVKKVGQNTAAGNRPTPEPGYIRRQIKIRDDHGVCCRVDITSSSLTLRRH